MKNSSKIIPVIDLFAGPGGLSEGFSRYSDFVGSDMAFSVKLSVEKDPVARKTLRLRSFVRQFPEGRLPDAYYGYIRCTDNAIGQVISDTVLNSIDDTSIRNRMRDIRDRKNTNLTRGALFMEGGWEAIKIDPKLARWISDPNLGGVCQHETRTHMDPDFARYLFAAVYGEIRSASPKLSHFPKHLLPNHSNIFETDGNGRKQLRGDFNDRFRVQLSGEPARTIVSHIAKDGHYFIHYDPEQCRSLTVREAARIQTFPDNYFFEGNRTQQYQQVGNAVPPFLALKLAEVVAELIKQPTDGSTERHNLQQAVPVPSE